MPVRADAPGRTVDDAARRGEGEKGDGHGHGGPLPPDQNLQQHHPEDDEECIQQGVQDLVAGFGQDVARSEERVE